jgi:hypothetical protein
MVMSVGFDNLLTILTRFGQFLCPVLGDRSHHQSLKVKTGQIVYVVAVLGNSFDQQLT